MKKNRFGFLFVLVLMSLLLLQEKYRAPSTKNLYLSLKIQGTSLQNYIVDCGGASGGVIAETCLLSGEPDVGEIDAALKNTQWRDFSDNRYALSYYRGWCKEHARIYLGRGKKGWQITYLFDMAFQCPG
ncbi:hypothetical protein OX459_17230 [Janthinobacterium sp. SUN026]|uniref:hypothetical protein n=1 Tax=Janthinobacterium sp. SUN026 TaxID=3002438 RepID=UPI0025B18B43|nr:hypothetical protein [Janthinobacterium sp. SUN026]MDN2673145.1 hypothetical protein [Janthinobacterium sp. SUN026]